MMPYFQNCLFCGADFSPGGPSRSREHIIPKFLSGSFVIMDVCEICNNKLGAEADHLALQDSRIIDAINTLNLPEMMAKVREIGDSYGIDTIDGRHVRAKFHKGKPRLITKPIDPDGIESPEEDALSILHKLVQRDDRLDWTSEERREYVNNVVWPEYQAIEPGEACNFPSIGRELRKRQVREFVTIPKWSKGAAHRLVAKIIFEICHYTLDWSLLQLVTEDLNWYGAFAYGEVSDEEKRFGIRDAYESRQPTYHHLIQILFYPHFIAVDVDFFRSVNFRGWLFPHCEYNLPLFKGDEVEGFGIAITFEPSKSHEKFLAYRKKSTGKWTESPAMEI